MKFRLAVLVGAALALTASAGLSQELATIEVTCDGTLAVPVDQEQALEIMTTQWYTLKGPRKTIDVTVSSAQADAWESICP